MMDAFELIVDLLQLTSSFVNWDFGLQPPPRARPDDRTPLDVSEIVRIVAGTPRSGDDRPDAKILLRDSRPEDTSALQTAQDGDS
jgi:hypothetical protein